MSRMRSGSEQARESAAFVSECQRFPFGGLLREFRLAAGLSQQALAERARMSTIGVGALERGDRRAPYRETVALLAAALELSTDDRVRLEVAALYAARTRRLRNITPSETEQAQHNLTPNLTSFIARDVELGAIVALVREHRLVTVTGTGGIGKTRTAVQIGSLLSTTSIGSVWFVDLAPLFEGSAVTSAIATTLGIKESPDHPLLDTLVAHLKMQKMLLILDNCEHVVSHAALVVDTLLRHCQELRIIATSREPLRVSGERTYRLPSLSVPSGDPVRQFGANEAMNYAAIALFAGRARAADNRFTLTDANARIVRDICWRLDGIPLAIELAAARVGLLSLKTLLERLDDRFAILADGERTALRRHQTMRGVIDWSYNLLSDREQTLFRCLSIFAGGFSLELAEAVSSHGTLAVTGILPILASLVQKSFVQVDLEGDDARYRLLESARQYAYEKLTELNEYHSAARSHASAMLDLAERLEAEWLVTPDEPWMMRVRDELQNWRAALAWSFGINGDVRTGQRIAGAMRIAWYYLAAWEQRRWITAALETADADTSPRIVARLKLTQAYLFVRFGRITATVNASKHALELFAKLDDSLGVADAHRCLGHALISLGRVLEGTAFLERALAIFRPIDVRKMIGLTLEDLGNACSLRDDLIGARALYSEAIAIFKASGADRLLPRVAMHLAEAEFRSGDPETALVTAGTALAQSHAFHDVRVIQVNLNQMAAYLIALDRWDDARSHARDALALARDDPGACTEFALLHLASVATLRPGSSAEHAYEQLERAAKLFGFANARLPQLDVIRDHAEQMEYDRVYAVLCDALGSEELDRVMDAGRAMADDRAIEEALSI